MRYILCRHPRRRGGGGNRLRDLAMVTDATAASPTARRSPWSTRTAPEIHRGSIPRHPERDLLRLRIAWKSSDRLFELNGWLEQDQRRCGKDIRAYFVTVDPERYAGRCDEDLCEQRVEPQSASPASRTRCMRWRSSAISRRSISTGRLHDGLHRVRAAAQRQWRLRRHNRLWRKPDTVIAKAETARQGRSTRKVGQTRLHLTAGQSQATSIRKGQAFEDGFALADRDRGARWSTEVRSMSSIDRARAEKRYDASPRA